MSRNTSHYPLSVICPFVVLTMGCGVGGLYADEQVRHAGWAVGMIGLGVLLISLTRLIRIEVSENRIQFMTRIAQEAIDYVGAESAVASRYGPAAHRDIDDEWEQFNR